MPIACTLTAADLRDRQAAWLKVGAFLRRSLDIPGGRSFEFSRASGVYESLEQLIQLEAECCAWLTFGLTQAGEQIAMTIVAEGSEGETAAREMFGPLSDLVGRV
jgi:hypothetical protein